MKILILGATGMLGHTLFNFLSKDVNTSLDVYGTLRSNSFKEFFNERLHSKLIVCKDVLNNDLISAIFENIRPNVVINCISINSRTSSSQNIIETFSLLPHALSFSCKEYGARLIQISSDGVFSGKIKIPYTEDDLPNANDIYGKAKHLGEVHSDNVINIRTSIIGHEIHGNNGLLEWFLSLNKKCNCYTNVVFNGTTTLELSRIILNHILPYSNTKGVYHVGSSSISRCELLHIIASIYGKKMSFSEVLHDKEITRILNFTKFSNQTGYKSKNWNQLIGEMCEYNKNIQR